MSTVREYLAGLAKKTGVKQDDEALQAILAASALNEVEMPDSLLSQLNKGIYTKEAAKNDQEIQDHYYSKIKGDVYSVFDDILNKNIGLFNLSDEQKEEILSEDSTPKRVKQILKAAATAKPGKEVDVTKFNDKINELNDTIKTLKETHSLELDQVKNQSRNNETDLLLKSKILSAPLIDEDKIPGGKEYLADAIIKKVRAKFHVDRDESNNLLLKDLKDPTMEAFLDNEKQEIEKVLSNELHPFIKRSDNNPPDPSKKKVQTSTNDDDPNNMTIQQWIKHKKASA